MKKSVLKDFLKTVIKQVVPIFLQALKDLWDEIVEEKELEEQAKIIIENQEKDPNYYNKGE